MLHTLIHLCCRHPTVVCFLAFAATIMTLLKLHALPLDALPDLSDTQVIVFADWPGRAPDIIESQVTYPLTTALLSTPKVRYVRGTSMSGASQITAVFEDGTDLYWARTRMAEKIAAVTTLPAEVSARLGPEATGLGWVFQYALVDRSGQHDLAQLRSFQDWHLKTALESVRGVAEVATIGGFVKEIQVQIDPVRLLALKLTPLHVIRAIRAGNQEIGAGTLEMAETEYSIRATGYVTSVADIEDIPVQSSASGRVVKVSDVAQVQLGPARRAGLAELDGEGETVGGIVVMRVGENALNVIEGVKAKLSSLASSMPKGIEIVPVYDRSNLITRAIATLGKVLVEEIVIVSLIVSVFLWHVRASIVAIIPLPIAVLLSFVPMLWSGFTANIMSLGGIALAIGAMVDSSIILVENAHKRLEGRDTRLMSSAERRTIISDALVEVGRPLFFSLLVITVSFLPIFALEDREGRLFKPLAFTKTVSMAWACVLAVTLTPALAILFLKGRFVEEQRHAVSRFLHKAYGPIVDWSLMHRYWVASTAAALALLSVPVYLSIPSEFMPALAEGSVLYMPTAVPGMSIDTAASVIQQQNRIIRTVPEVEHVFGKAGRSTSATDPAPLSMFETVITLKPKEQWREGISFESIIAELNGKLDLPGMPNIWWMPIQTRIEMLSTGVRTAVGVKILGDSLEDIAKTAEAIETVLRKVPGTKSAFAERVALGQSIEIDIDRSLAAMYGLDIASIHSLIEAAVGGRQASTFFSGRERYAITVRYQRDARDSLAALDDLALFAPDGRLVKLSQIAAIRVKHGPAMIASENAKLLGFVFVDVAPHVGLAEYVASARSAVSQAVTLPQQTSLVWSGQFESLQRARATLIWIIPLTLALIILLLYMNTRSATETAIILAAVPFSLLGAFLLIKVLGYKISVASWVGILALAGLDAETGVVMMMYLSQAWNGLVASGRVIDTKALLAAIHEGAVRRVRPKLMTVAATLMGLLPVMWSQGTGAEVMKRIAAPMVGGMVTSAVLELLVYPALFYIWKSRSLPTVPNTHPESNKAPG